MAFFVSTFMRIFFENVSTIAFLLYRYNFRSPATAWELEYRMNWFYFRCDSRCNSCIIFIWKSNINQFNIFPKVCYAFKAKIFWQISITCKKLYFESKFLTIFFDLKRLGRLNSTQLRSGIPRLEFSSALEKFLE